MPHKSARLFAESGGVKSLALAPPTRRLIRFASGEVEALMRKRTGFIVNVASIIVLGWIAKVALAAGATCPAQFDMNATVGNAVICSGASCTVGTSSGTCKVAGSTNGNGGWKPDGWHYNESTVWKWAYDSQSQTWVSTGTIPQNQAEIRRCACAGTLGEDGYYSFCKFGNACCNIVEVKPPPGNNNVQIGTMGSCAIPQCTDSGTTCAPRFVPGHGDDRAEAYCKP